MNEELKISQWGEAHIFSLNRPASGNSLSSTLVEVLHDALDAFERSGGRVLILTGEGRNFCTRASI
jgi:enoyl-CoA hydratase/carnithine racemase